MRSLIFVSKNLLILITIFINCLIVYLDRYFGEVNFEQLIFHINFSNNLIIDSDEYIIKKFFQICVLIPFLLIILINIFFFISSKFQRAFNNLLFSILIFFLLIFTLIRSNDFIKFGEYYSNNKYDIIEKNYISPKKIEFNFEKSQNLILIYVESFENIFQNENIFGENLIEELNEYNKDSVSFKNFVQTPLTEWTIASIVATQCGLPLKNYGLFTFGKQTGKHLRTVFGFDNFLPNAICLGDLLENNGYENIFIGSHNTTFTGTGNFFKTHGYKEVYGKEIYDKLDITYHPGSWGEGPNDSFLFNFAKEKLDRLVNDKKKFLLTILTTDTHEPFGYHDPKCNSLNQDIQSAIKCSSKSILDFISFIENEYPGKMKIIILGDHLYRFGNKNDFLIPNNRTIFNKFLTNEDKEIMRNNINHYDFYPTILDFIDVRFNDNKIGLGYSGFKEVSLDEYKFQNDQIKNNILNKSKFYESFWK